jgi:hypothetical protein
MSLCLGKKTILSSSQNIINMHPNGGERKLINRLYNICYDSGLIIAPKTSYPSWTLNTQQTKIGRK